MRRVGFVPDRVLNGVRGSGPCCAEGAPGCERCKHKALSGSQVFAVAISLRQRLEYVFDREKPENIRQNILTHEDVRDGQIRRYAAARCGEGFDRMREG